MKDLLIEEDKTILETMQILNKNGRQILFVLKDQRLTGVVTDGDIRRWILKDGNLNEPIRNVANHKPIFLYEDQADSAGRILKEKKIRAIPIVDRECKIGKIIFADELESPRLAESLQEKVPIVIMAGGLGTRLSPYTNILPKPLIPIGDYPIVEHIINRFRVLGCDEYYMIVNYKRNMIKAYFGELEKDYTVHFIEEEQMLGTGGGISLLKGKIKKTFILTNCDILIEADMAEAYMFHKAKNNLITMICAKKNITIPYGVIEEEDGYIKKMVEKPRMSFLTNTGCYIVEPEVVEELDYNRPIDFPDIIERYRNKGRKTGVFSIEEDAWLDMGQIDELGKMKQRLSC